MRISDLKRVCIYMVPELRECIYRRALKNSHSLMVEVNITLLQAYMPTGWSKLIRDVEERARHTNPPQVTKFSRRYVSVGVHVPSELHEKIAVAAKANFRSWSAEAVQALTKAYL